MNGKGLAISSFSGEPQATACFACGLRIADLSSNGLAVSRGEPQVEDSPWRATAFSNCELRTAD